MTWKAQAIVAKIYKSDYIKLKFCTAEEIIDRVKMQPTELEKALASHISDRRLISKIHKKFLLINCNKTNNLIKT